MQTMNQQTIVSKSHILIKTHIPKKKKKSEKNLKKQKILQKPQTNQRIENIKESKKEDLISIKNTRKQVIFTKEGAVIKERKNKLIKK